ncbi:DUF4352 domain-containing protein [Oceanobacillus massiliensis]|uniref:DUF4352 domain-containing protein n=1 Tax=Oceanobacillus massiliensis TaxID=1465765 RepID=UPI00301780AA
MERILKMTISSFMLCLLLVACNGEDNNHGEEESQESVEGSSTENGGSDDDQAEPSEEESGDTSGTEQPSSNEGELPENQLGLSIGDTAHLKNDYREYEITLNSVEITEKAGEEPSLEGNYVIVDVTLTNLSDEAAYAADAFSTTFLSTEAEGYAVPWFYVDGVAEEWTEEIAPGGSQTGVLLYDMEVSDSYVLHAGRGYEGLSNQISFEFSTNEVE